MMEWGTHRDTGRWTQNLGTCLSFCSFRYNKRTKTVWIVKTNPWYWRFDKFLIWTLYAVGYAGRGSRYFALKVFKRFVTPDCAFVSTKWRRSLALPLLSSISIFHLRWRRKEFVELSRGQMQHLWPFDNDPFLGRISFCTCFFSLILRIIINKILSSLVVGVSFVRLINDGSLWIHRVDYYSQHWARLLSWFSRDEACCGHHWFATWRIIAFYDDTWNFVR